MASSKRKKHGAGYVVLIAVLILVLLAVVAAVTGYSLVARRVKALQAGAAFTFDYEITSTVDSPALYTILQKTGSTKGTVCPRCRTVFRCRQKTSGLPSAAVLVFFTASARAGIIRIHLCIFTLYRSLR